MRFLVTGGTDFVGSHIVKHLVKLGHEVIATGQCSQLMPPEVKVLYPSLIGINWNAIGKVDVLYHCDGLRDLRIQDQAELERSNARATLETFHHLIEDCGCKHIVYSSSVSIYGNAPVPFQEPNDTSPINCYGRSMRLMEDAIQLMEAQYKDVVFVGLRLANPYGPGESFCKGERSIVLRIARELYRRPAILFADGDMRRDFVYIDDVVEAFIRAMSAQQSVVVNCGSGESISYNELYHLIRRVLKIGKSWITPKYIPNEIPDMQQHTWCDMSLAEKVLGFRPAHSISNGLVAYKASGQLP